MPSPDASVDIHARGIRYRHGTGVKVRTQYAQLQFANGRSLTKFCSSHEIFTMRIKRIWACHESFVPRKFGAIRYLPALIAESTNGSHNIPGVRKTTGIMECLSACSALWRASSLFLCIKNTWAAKGICFCVYALNWHTHSWHLADSWFLLPAFHWSLTATNLFFERMWIIINSIMKYADYHLWIIRRVKVASTQMGVVQLKESVNLPS